VRRRIGHGTPRSGREDGRVHVWVDEDPDAHAPSYPEVPHGDEDGVRPVVVGFKDGRHVAALEERVGPLEKRLDVRDEEPRRNDHTIMQMAQAPRPRGTTEGAERLGAPLRLVASVVVG